MGTSRIDAASPDDSFGTTPGNASQPSKSTLLRLETQIDVIPILLSGATYQDIVARPDSGQWSAQENLAHLGRHHEVFLERLHLILKEDAPQIDQYRAENDALWPEWKTLPLDEILTRLQALREEIIKLIKGLSADDKTRIGIHSLFGEMSLTVWLEFFLLHEAHHLYIVMTRLAQAKRSAGAPPSDKPG